MYDGVIKWDKEKLDKRLSITTFKNELCQQCKLLPLCWEPCCQKLLETGNSDVDRFCQKESMEISLSDYIRYRFNNSYIANQLL